MWQSANNNTCKESKILKSVTRMAEMRKTVRIICPHNNQFVCSNNKFAPRCGFGKFVPHLYFVCLSNRILKSTRSTMKNALLYAFELF